MPPKKRGLTAEEIKAKNIAETKSQLLKLNNVKVQLFSELKSMKQTISSDEHEIQAIKERIKGNSNILRIENEMTDAQTMIDKNKKGSKLHEEAKKRLQKLTELKNDVLRCDEIESELSSKRAMLESKQVDFEAAEQKYLDFAQTKAKGLKISIDDADSTDNKPAENCFA